MARDARATRARARVTRRPTDARVRRHAAREIDAHGYICDAAEAMGARATTLSSMTSNARGVRAFWMTLRSSRARMSTPRDGR